MNRFDPTIAKEQLGVAQQHLGWYRKLKGNKYHEDDETKQLHDAIQALEIALNSIVRQLSPNNDREIG